MFYITYLTGYLFSVLSFKSESSLIVQFGWGCEMGTGCTLGLCFFLRLLGFGQGIVTSKFRFVWVSVNIEFSSFCIFMHLYSQI